MKLNNALIRCKKWQKVSETRLLSTQRRTLACQNCPIEYTFFSCILCFVDRLSLLLCVIVGAGEAGVSDLYQVDI